MQHLKKLHISSFIFYQMQLFFQVLLKKSIVALLAYQQSKLSSSVQKSFIIYIIYKVLYN